MFENILASSCDVLSLGFTTTDHNNFMKAVPIGYFVDLKALKKLDLSYNIFTGLIHDDWSERWDESNLEELDVSSNVFNGEVRTSLP